MHKENKTTTSEIIGALLGFGCIVWLIAFVLGGLAVTINILQTLF